MAAQTNGIKEITAKELKSLIDRKDKFTLVDVREQLPAEFGYIERSLRIVLSR